jgi:Arc/MetJ family transcription regulator
MFVCVLSFQFLHTSSRMRTNIEIDDDLLARAMKAAGLKTKRATVEEALRRLVASDRRRQAIENMRGLGWDGDLDAMRRGVPPSDEA